MRTPHGLELRESCRSFKLDVGGLFGELSPAALEEFDTIKSFVTYPQGTVLFVEKQDPRGIYVLCEGQVKLSISSSEGKTMILRIANPGEILGLMSAMSEAPYEVTAETLHPCQAAFVRRDDFLRFIARHTEAYRSVTRQLASQYQSACEHLRTVALAASAPEKLAKLLLHWADGARHTEKGTCIKIPLTHQEIAEFIGTTRETVSRTLSDFKFRGLITQQGSTWMIPDRTALEHSVDA